MAMAMEEEDDEDFDWEAAVKEIDVACQSASLVRIDAEAAKTWIYPVNVPLRDYQLSITKTALFSNTLVALPTGLGKTLIAAVVIFNYFRWFPSGKIVFAAPSRPLVLQQIEACHNIVGIPQEWTIHMTGLMNPTKRASFWKTKRVFFLTPQVLEKDIQSGSCSVKHLVCLVIDEAHRALGNYSYCVVIRQLMTVPVPLRILALTATPGSKHQGIQQIIDNLQISTLQYRDESDPDVSPYVHDRKIELIQVPMGDDAVEINNMILEVIRTFVTKLSSMGIFLGRDYKTLSPCDLLNSRDKFRQAPQADHPHIKYQDVEGFFGVLITLYHIRKLLSSHGIRPASEMLEEKLKQGSFARFMSKNDLICEVRLIMQKSLSHGAPSPKLSKMMEVLVDHFKTKDPQNSRVIIFSNFRGSVRDIMDALTKVGDIVRATEFIGQSSGKTLKGQSQKVQQAVLEKFRAGGYNVIVATSIGEEGLDIMEVDLVICFDANISPLRMIQRMGRTGRKHDGRVVVLACEGSELKGYMRKKTNSKSMKKLMQNGGMNSFTFIPSPRMIPHTIRSEVQFVKLSIEQFVRPGKRVKDNHAIHTTLFKNKLTSVEAELLLKYFHPCKDTWRPSLTAFPHFQTFPSRTHRVTHSSRTMIFIDIMQHLQGLHFSRDTKAFSNEEKSCVRELFEADHVEQCDDSKRGSLNEANTSKAVERSRIYPENVDLLGSCGLSVDATGMDPISCFPVFSSKKFLHSNSASASSKEMLNCFELGSDNVKTSAEDLIVQTKTINEPPTSETKFLEDEILSSPETDGMNVQEDETMDQIDKVHQTAALKRNWFNEGDSAGEMPSVLELEAHLPLADEFSITESQLSPRLTNLVNSGFVPDSPIDDCGNSSRHRICESAIPQFTLPVQVDNEMLLKTSSPGGREMINCNGGSHAGDDYYPTSTPGQIQTPTLKENNSVGIKLCAPTSPVVDKTRTPLAVLASSSNSEDWHLVSGEKFNSVHKPHKFKRLRKVGDMEKNKNMESMEETSLLSLENIVRSFSSTRHIKKEKRDGERRVGGDDNVQAFIEEEAEVSSDATISDDEEDDRVKSSLDSFIDDRVSDSATCTQDETGRPDMMAVYRRSLRSQSPFERLTSPTSMALESASSCGKTLNIFKPESSEMHSQSMKRKCSPEGVIYFGRRLKEVGESIKRKMTFCGSEINLEKKLSDEMEMGGRETNCDVKVNGNDMFNDDDDEFYEGVDLDAIEAEATLLLKKKKLELLPPSFDLGFSFDYQN